MSFNVKEKILMLIMNFKQIKKAAEISWIQIVVAEGISSRVERNYRNTETVVAEEASAIKEWLQNGSENVTVSLKGKFGNEVREAIKAESKKMNRF